MWGRSRLRSIPTASRSEGVEVLEHITAGKTYREIAEEMGHQHPDGLYPREQHPQQDQRHQPGRGGELRDAA